MKLKYLIMCILTMMSIVMKAQDNVLYEVSTTPATTLNPGSMYVLQNAAYRDFAMVVEDESISSIYMYQLWEEAQPMHPAFFTAGQDGIRLNFTLQNINDRNIDDTGLGYSEGGTLLARPSRTAFSEPTYFTVKDAAGQCVMFYTEYLAYGINATNPEREALWVAYEVTEHSQHQWNPETGTCTLCGTECPHPSYTSLGLEEGHQCDVCGYQGEHMPPNGSDNQCPACGLTFPHIYDENGYCLICGIACEHQWIASDETYSQCSVCSSKTHNVASVTIDGTTSYYVSAEAAFAKAAEGTAEKPAAIKLLKDCVKENDDQYFIRVTSGVMTLDLNGHTLSHGFDGESTIHVEGGDLTIEDSSEAQTGKVANSSYAIRYISGSLTINGGTFCSNDGLTSNTSGMQALFAFNATMPYTPGSIKLRGGVFMNNRGNSSILVPYNGSVCWDLIDMDGYCFVDNETDKFVPVPTNNPNLMKSVVVKPLDNYAPFEVTIDGVSKKYISTEAAFAKAAEGTAEKPAAIKMLNDYEKAAGDNAVNVTSGVMTLDLNGYTLSHAFFTGATIQMDGGDLTIEDSSEAQTGKVANSSFAIRYISGSLTINGGTFCSNDGLTSDTSGSQALFAINATMPYTPGSIKLRGGVFMNNGGNSSILVPYNGSAGWDLIDMDGYCFVDNEIGKVVSATTANPNLYESVVVKPVDDCYVASVTIDGDTQKYLSAEDAFAKAAEGTAEKPATIKMLKDCVNNSYQYYIKVMAGVMTLDLNGYTLSHNYSGESTIHVEGGDLTIEDSSEAQTGKVANSFYAIKYVSGSLTINGGTFCSNDGSSYNTSGMYALYASAATQPYTPGSIKLRGGVFMMNDDNASIVVPDNDNDEPCWDIIDLDGYYLENVTTGNRVELPENDSKLNVSVAVKKPQTPTIYIADQKIVLNEESIAAFNDEHNDVQLTLEDEETVGILLNDYKYDGAPALSEGGVSAVIKSASEGLTLHLTLEGRSSINISKATDADKLAAIFSNALVISGDGTLDITISDDCYADEVAGVYTSFLFTNGRGLKEFVGEEDLGQLADMPEFSGGIRVYNNASGDFVGGYFSPIAIMCGGYIEAYVNSSSTQSVGITSLQLMACNVIMTVESSGYALASIVMETAEAELELKGQEGICFGADPSRGLQLMNKRMEPEVNYGIKAGTSEKDAQDIAFKEITEGMTVAILPADTKYLHSYHSVELSEDNVVELFRGVDGDYYARQNVVINDNEPLNVPVRIVAKEGVTYNRTITKDGGKYSFYVPFCIPAEQAAELGKFYVYDHHDSSKVYFKEETDDVADNTGYFFAPAKDITSITVENCLLNKTTSAPDINAESWSGLYGTYSTVAIPEGAYGYGTDGYFTKAVGTGNRLPQFRAFLWLEDSAGAAKMGAVFGNEDDIATGISTIGTDGPSAIYNISGQRISTPIKGGIYIKDGRKVVKK